MPQRPWTLDDTTVTGTTITDSGMIKIDATEFLKLNGVALTQGAITNFGTIEITGQAASPRDALANTQLTVDSARLLTLDGTTVTGGTITNTGAALAASATKTVTLDNVIVNSGSITDDGTVMSIQPGR